jgi:ABC-type glycerol-3-phosphate transport system substrate-binding protein
VAFLRVWPNVFAWSNDASKSQVVQKFDVAPLPASTNALAPSQSCLGGWQLTLNNFATSEKKDAAWQFIWWMLQEEAQQYMAVREGFLVTLKSIYNDPYVRAWNALFARLPLLEQLLDSAQLRPLSTCYPQVADAIEHHINRALTRLDAPEQALQSLQTNLESIISRCQQTQKFVCSSL